MAARRLKIVGLGYFDDLKVVAGEGSIKKVLEAFAPLIGNLGFQLKADLH